LAHSAPDFPVVWYLAVRILLWVHDVHGVSADTTEIVMRKLRFSENGSPSEQHVPQRVAPQAPLQVPDSVLERHGARILRPSEAARLTGAPPPRPTVYRYGVLLVPEDLLRSNVLPALAEPLAEVGLALVPPQPLDRIVGPEKAAARAFAGLPRPVGVTAARGRATPVDAWTALQALWSAVERGRIGRKVVSRIGLEHLLAGSALTGVGTVNLTGTNAATQGSPDDGGLFTGPRTGLGGRIPVEVVLPEPDRPTPAGLGVSRRPVIAVLDTGIGAHPWFDTDLADLAAGPIGDQFLIVDSNLQQSIYLNGVANAAASSTPTEPISGYQDQPSIREPLIGELDTHYGHGTFIAGIVRQAAPGTQVFLIRVMHPDGFAHESDVLLALSHLTDEMQNNTLLIDLVSLSLGFFPETPLEVTIRDSIADALDALTATGVTVVAAAGNYSTSREFHPAALAGVPTPAGHAPIISVGALNPNGTVAHFSDEAPWVRCYAPGVAMVSAFPTTAGAVNPDETAVVGNHRREGFDPDDFTSGFAVWSGTSFATPLVAAELANALVDNAKTDSAEFGLGVTGPAATIKRAQQALASAKLQALESLEK
jgi:Subtilase family